MTFRKMKLLITVVVALSAATLSSTAWAQAPGGIHTTKIGRPYVMLLLDTSGSMEWRPATFAATEDRMPICDSIAGTYQKSRWITALEVLTGTFHDYTCTHVDNPEEPAYYIPHVQPAFSYQDADGVLDIYNEEIEFGLMTMDSFASPLTDATGMYSYPDGTMSPADRHSNDTISGDDVQGIRWVKTASPDCEYFWNVGARRPRRNDTEDFPGAMIPHDFVPSAATDPIYRARNTFVESELLDIAPYYASPIAGMLYDARYYFEQYPGIQPMSGGVGDCYANCRDRHVILITDGIPSADGRPECSFTATGDPPDPGACPYPRAYEIALELYNLDPTVQVHVIGFSAVDDTTEDYDEDGNVIGTVNEIWRIGQYGWGGAEENCPEDEDGDPECALYADDADELRAALGRIFDTIVAGSASHTKTATINAVVSDAMGQHQVFSSMEVSVGGTWEGNLERSSVVCQLQGDGTWDMVPRVLSNGRTVLDYGDDALDLVSIPSGEYHARRLFTADPLNPGGSSWIRFDDTNMTPALLGVADNSTMNEVLNWMHGADGTMREFRRLGAIYHTSPAIVGPPTMELPLTSYNVGPHRHGSDTYADIGFRQLLARRENIIYAASMDGILHAFRLDYDLGDDPASAEMWGFIPPMLLESLDTQRRGQMFLLDGHIQVQDLRLWKPQTPSGDPSDYDEWATVLVMGLRHGGGNRGYFALDVTAPTIGGSSPSANTGTGSMDLPADPGFGEPEFLWEISNETATDPYTSYESLASFAGLGQTYGRAAFGTVLINDVEHSGSTGEVSVTILPAGRRPADETNLAVGCGLYIVNTKNGRLIRWLHPLESRTDIACELDGSNEASCTYDTDQVDCQFTGTPLALGGVPGEITTRVFVGDSRGRLYRADLSDPNPSNWSLDPFFSFYEDGDTTAQPILDAPAAAIDHRGLVTLVFGSGNPDDLESRATTRMVSLTEMFDLGTSPIVGGDNACHLNYSDVETSFVGSEFERPDACSGHGRVYPWVNWAFSFEPGAEPDAANLDGDEENNEGFVQGERLMGAPVIFNEVAYFTTFVPSDNEDDCCMPGHGRVLGVHYVGDTTDDITDTTDVFYSPTDSTASIGIPGGRMADNELAYGLAIVRQPSCATVTQDPSTGEWVPNISNSGPAEYEIVVHNNSQPEPAVDGDPAPPQTGVLELTLPAPPLQCYPDTWISLFGE